MRSYNCWARVKRVVLTGCLAALAGACDEKIDAFFAPLEQSATTGGIAGRVTSGGVGLMASVGLTGPESRTGTSDASGNYSFTNLLEGNYELTATAPGVSCQPQSATVVAGQVDQTDITCTPLPATINVTVTIQGSPAPNVGVTLAGPTPGTLTTGANGTATFTNKSPGSYTVTAQVSGHSCPSATTNPAAGETVNVTINCTPLSATIAVTVTGPGGPISGVNVTLTGPTGGTGTTDANGQVTFTNRTAGSYTISVAATAQGFSCPPGAANPAPGATANVLIVCTPITGTLVVTVSSSGSPVAGATVSVSGPTPGTAVTDVNGMATFTNRGPGGYTIGALRTGFVCGTTTANVVAGQTGNAAISCTPSP